jgi:GTP-binding protein
MKFIDEARIYVKGGDGGKGCISFRREKFVPKGGPDGGDGGRGGDIILVSDSQLLTLEKFCYRSRFIARHGEHGKGKKQHGRDADDIIIRVPVGTIIIDDKAGEILGDLDSPGEKILVAKGGKGGKGNARFVSSINQAPRHAEPGFPGEEKWLRLELKILADVGLIGFPNVGKSTLISRLSNAKPKISDYPFTTLYPNLGVVKYDDYDSFIIADIPGLIKDAHKGMGLGIKFLRHIERTNILIHIIDASYNEWSESIDRFEKINEELKAYNPLLLNKPQVIAINKIDLKEGERNYKKIKEYFDDLSINSFPISALKGEGIDILKEEVIKKLKEVKRN